MPRAALDHDNPAPRPSPAEECALGRRFAEAFTAADIDAVIALLTDDARLSMPPAPHEYHGTDAIAAFLNVSFACQPHLRLLFVPTAANGQLAYGSYLHDPGEPTATPAGLFVLTMTNDGAGPRVRTITRFHLDTLYPRFDLPTRLTGLAPVTTS